MKDQRLFQGFMIILFLFTFFTCTTNSEEEDPAPNDTENILDAKTAFSKLQFENALKKTGKIPSSSALADLKIDKDTIFLIEGFKNRVQIKNPLKSFSATSSFYFEVVGGDEYYDIKFDEKESTDTIGVFYLGFDPDDLELPLSFKAKIAPKDESGDIIEPIEIDVVVEKKGEPLCGPTNPHTNWRWLWTTHNDILYASPNYPIGTVASVNGCCFEGESVDCITNYIKESEWISMDYFSYQMIKFEEIAFGADGSMAGVLIDATQNIDPSESDFCNQEPSYIHRTNENVFWGDYTYDPSTRKITFTKLESQERQIYLEEIDYHVTTYDKVFLSTMATYEILSCHFLLETSNMEGMKRQRLFERIKKTDKDGNEVKWYN